MSHELEIGANGEVAFALRGQPAWHGLANALFDVNEHITTAEMLKSAKLNDWNVRLEPITLPSGYRTTKPNYLVARDNPFDSGTDVLSIVGDRYRVFQNEQLFEFGDGILDGGATWESAGSIKDGRVVFGSLVVPKEFILDPQGANDKTITYLLVHTSHDGSTAVQANITPVRVVCQNTLNMALNGSKQSFRIRHTQTVQGRVDEARRVLGLTFEHMDKFEDLAKDLFETAVTDKEFFDLVAAIYPKPDINDSKVTKTKYDNKVGIIYDLYFSSPTQENIKGTAWGVLNALTERLDYFRVGRKGTQEGVLAAASGFEPVVNAEKNKILTAVKSLV
jgi:phage/plasmid-like protein (TIGR03299 family)